MAHPVGKPGRDVLRLLRLDQPTVGEAQRTYEESRAGITGQPDQIPANWPRLAEAGRGWRPRLEAEAGGRPELDLALAGRIKAGG